MPFAFKVLFLLLRRYSPTWVFASSILRLQALSSADMLVKLNGKAVPLQAWSGPEGSSKLRFPDFMTTAQDGGKVVSLRHRPPLPPGNTPGTHFC
jgi:hypothetical protein